MELDLMESSQFAMKDLTRREDLDKFMAVGNILDELHPFPWVTVGVELK